MRKSRAIIVIILLMFLLSCCYGCTKKRETSDVVTSEKETIQIGMSFDSFVIERWIRDRDIFVSTAKELGAEVNVQNANGDIEEQKRQIDYFIEKEVDAIVIICVDSSGLTEYVEKAHNKGIKVIAYDRLVYNANVDLYISFDNAMVGRIMAETLVENGIQNKNVIMLGGSLLDSNVPIVENAFIEVMDENNVSILEQIHADGWEAEIAGDYIYNNVDVVARADAIMCGNDDLASQVIPALASKRLAGNILVVGQDADLQACQRIVEGTQLMTVYKPVDQLAKCAAQCVVQLIKYGKISDKNLTEYYDGSYDVPYIGIPPMSVTKENIDDVIIKTGFHLKEDVYLNVPDQMPK